ncbi:arylsulfatase B-like [Amphiura filiformis]|uniref:arylsulfatase B-like n=1 Tax=Amphiura filiformis TaxID=82378 RepID=UPI003B228808
MTVINRRRRVLGIIVFVTILLCFVWIRNSGVIPSSPHRVSYSETKPVFPPETIKQPAITSDTKPNIIFILADDYGYNDIGYHGKRYGGIINTPVLDKLAYEGVILENYYVQPMCSPTRIQLMTGRYQIRMGNQHKTIGHAQPLCFPLDEVTLPQKLREANYTTHMVGKWHAGLYKAACLPHRRGFESFFGFLLGKSDYFYHSEGCGCKNGSDLCSGIGYDLHENDMIADPQKWMGQYSTTIFTDRAISIIKEQKEPLFLYVSYQAVHAPLQPPKDPAYDYKNISDGNRRNYSAMVSYMDHSVGRIVDALKQTNKWKNSVLVFSTDNGGFTGDNSGNNWPLRGQKATLWEGGVRGIGFVNSPLIPPHSRGRVSHELMHVTDWFPTFVQGLAGGSLNGTKPLDGFNLWETIRDKKPSARTEILHNIDPMITTNEITAEFRHNEEFFTPNTNAAIRVGDWKLITHESKKGDWRVPPELESTLRKPAANNTYQLIWLFNIKTDPSETNDLSKAHPEKVQELLQRLQHYNKTSVPIFYPDCDIKASPSRYSYFWIPWGETDWEQFTQIKSDSRENWTKNKLLTKNILHIMNSRT